MRHHSNALVTRTVCGRCGVYRHLHPVDRCKGLRLSWWRDRHSLIEHVGAWLWIHALTSKARWAIAAKLTERGRDWCDLVDSVLRADQWNDEQTPYGPSKGWKHDYRGDYSCLCDFPTPWSVGPPRPGQCYCPPETAVS